MNKKVKDYLENKKEQLSSTTENIKEYIEKNGKQIKRTATGVALAALTTLSAMGMSGCDLQHTDTTEPSSSSGTIDPNKIVQSNSGLFEGTRYDKAPVINHRTEEEIAETGLTAQDVLNAYDQLCLDILKDMYSDNYYSDLSKDAYNKISAQFESITPWFFKKYSSDKSEILRFDSPFYAVRPNYFPKQFWQSMSSDIGEFPAVPITINIKAFADGVCFTETIPNAGIAPEQFANTMSSFGIKPYTLDYDTLYESTKNIGNGIDSFFHFLNQTAYEPMHITRETILNATPEQLESLYGMLSSTRSIVLEQKLPENSAEMGE